MPKLALRGSLATAYARRIKRRAVQARRRKQVGRRMMGDSFARRVMRVVNRTEETKYVANATDGALAALANNWYPLGALDAAGSWFPAMPKVTQGTDDYQRVGNKIRPSSLAVSLKVGFNPQNTQSASLIGVIYYGTSKDEKAWNVNTPIGATDILDEGDGTTGPFQGLRFQLNNPIDKKQYNIKRITFKLSKTEGIQNADISGNTVVQGNYSTSNGQSVKQFLLKLTPPKSLLYKAANSTFPMNYAPFFGVGFCHADGSVLQVADQNLVTVSSKCHMYFKDA